MRTQDYQFLSIWEIAHRWEGLDPAQDGVISVTSKLGERLRQLLWAATHALNGYDAHGELIPMEMLWFGFPKTSTAKKLELAFHDPGAYRDFLKSIFLSQQEVGKVFPGVVELPGFWFDENEVMRSRGYLQPRQPVPLNRVPAMRADQQDRLTCQDIAKRLWAEQPDMTIANMTKHPLILVEGNGKAYKGKNTLRNWLKEVAPDSVRKRRGRPKKSPKPKSPPQ